MAVDAKLIILAAAAGILVVYFLRSRREHYESAEERKARKIREVQDRYIADPTNVTSFIDLARAHGRQPEGYLERLQRKLGRAPPRNQFAEVEAGYSQIPGNAAAYHGDIRYLTGINPDLIGRPGRN